MYRKLPWTGGDPRSVAEIVNNLVAIARDGAEKDVKVHTEPYNEAVALEAFTWLAAKRMLNPRPRQSAQGTRNDLPPAYQQCADSFARDASLYQQRDNLFNPDRLVCQRCTHRNQHNDYFAICSTM